VCVWGTMNQWTTWYALWKIQDREASSNRCTHYTRCAAWNSCTGFVCSEEVAGDEVRSGFPSEVLELEFDYYKISSMCTSQSSHHTMFQRLKNFCYGWNLICTHSTLGYWNLGTTQTGKLVCSRKNKTNSDFKSEKFYWDLSKYRLYIVQLVEYYPNHA
jgi:hypothetical protein